LAIAGPVAPAAAEAFEAGRVVTAVSQTELAEIAASLGHAVKEIGGTGQTHIAAETPNGTVYLMFGTACDVGNVPGCQG
jgi:hypothetical protein